MASELAVVTGANRGIGLEVCRQLAQHGMRVLLTSRHAERGQEAADQLARHGLAVEARQLDVADPASVTSFGRALAEAGEPVHALVNNAGVSLDGFDAGVAERTLGTNTFGAAAVTDAVLPLLPSGSRVVMVSSGMGDLSAFSEPLRARFLDPASRPGRPRLAPARVRRSRPPRRAPPARLARKRLQRVEGRAERPGAGDGPRAP